MSNSKSQINCECCDAIAVSTPQRIDNIAGLNAIAYRIGRYSDFKESLLSGLSRTYFDSEISKKTSVSPLRKLTTRDDEDYSIALLDSWAVIADILTFYQEKIANESYLNTATEKFSVLELAKQIGYEFRPGVAAESYFAFMVDEASVSTKPNLLTSSFTGNLYSTPVKVEKGVKVQSIPLQNEEPQIFETIEEIEARVEWNDMKLKVSEKLDIVSGKTKRVYLQGQGLGLNIGQYLLFESGSAIAHSKILSATENLEEGYTDVVLNSTLAIDEYVETLPDVKKSTYSYETKELTAKSQGNKYIDWQSSINKKWQLLSQERMHKSALVPMYQIALNNANSVQMPDCEVYVYRKKAAIFGYNAAQRITYGNTVPVTVTQGDWPLDENKGVLFLDNVYEEIVKNSFVSILTPDTDNELNFHTYRVLESETRPRSAYGLSAKVTALKLEGDDWLSKVNSLAKIKSATVLIQSEPLLFAEKPLSRVIEENERTLDLSEFSLGLKVGQKIIITGESDKLVGVPLAELNSIENIDENFKTITLNTPLQNSFIRKTISINGNVAHASHGETVSEVLGDGNAALKFQKFFLKNTPLTYVSADNPKGVQSTLEVRVNNVLWKEVPYLYEKDSDEKIYITRQDVKGRTSIMFGDGTNGSRLSSGQQNIKATYRKGMGEKGLLRPKQLSNLLSKPLGIKEVVNPLATFGSQNNENFDQIRANANLNMYTLDRVVSLQDFEDFARAFPGVQKAKAVWVWSGNKKVIHVSVAGSKGSEISSTSSIYKNLTNALKSNSVPGVNFQVESYKLKMATIKTKLLIHPEFIKDQVVENVIQKLNVAYGFDKRDFGQHLYLGEISAFISNIPGVKAVDIDFLYLEDDVLRNEVLVARTALKGTDTFTLSEILVLEVGNKDIIAI